MARIGFTDKVDRRTLDFPIINKVTAANINEIKDSVNALYDAIEGLTNVTNIHIDAYDFDGDDYQDDRLIGLEVGTTLNIWSNSGPGFFTSIGALLKEGTAYSFDSETGTVTMILSAVGKVLLIQIITPVV